MVIREDHAVDLVQRPIADARPFRYAFAIGDLDALSVAVHAPAMERALNSFADDYSTMSQMRTHMGTMGIQQARPTGCRAKQHQIPAEVTQGAHIVASKFIAPADSVPTSWKRSKWKS